MHKIIQIKENPDCSSAGTETNGYVSSNSHKRLLGPSSSSSSSVSLRNGGCSRTNNNGHAHRQETDSCTDEENGTTELTQFRSLNRARHAKKKGMEGRKLLANCLAFSIPILFPTVHMYIFNCLWGHLKTPVDTKQCTCSCWDTVFKGPYESGIARYKHVYFNSDGNTLKMWVITVFGVLFLYEAFKRLFLLLLSKKLRWSMGVLFLSSLHSHYYAWWGHWNYWNDDFYQMWYHQVFFTLTELISSVMVLSYLDVRRAIEPIPMLVVCSIAVFHTLCSGWDQFVFTVVQGQGQLHQILRDVTLMMTDMIHAVISFHELRLYVVRKGITLTSLFFHRAHVAIIMFVFVTMYILILLFP